MTSDLRIQGEVVVNSEQAESAFNRVGDKAQQMATEVATSAGKAGQSVDKIGDGAGASAEKFTRAESRISASIKRATNELELLGKTASQRLEFNIADKGLDPKKFEPALQKLREVEAQAQAAQRAASGSLDKMGISAAQTAAALRGVPAQFTDIITSLQGGQAPLTVFLQQGGQLKDMFGGVGAAARALGGYVLGLINPFTLAAAAVGAIALAYNQGSKEQDAFVKSIVTTGNISGVTAGQLGQYARAISSVAGTQSKAAETLAAFVAEGVRGGAMLEEYAQTAIEWEKATGQSVAKTAEQFASLQKDPLSSVLKLNEGTNFLTESVYKQIKALDEQGRSADASRVAMDALDSAMATRSKTIEQNLGYIERAWRGITSAAKKAWDAMLNVGRADSLDTQIDNIRAKIAQAKGLDPNRRHSMPWDTPLAELEQQLANLTEQERMLRRGAEAESERNKQLAARIEFDKSGEQYLSKRARMEREIAKATNEAAAAGVGQAELEQRIASIREKFAEKNTEGMKAQRAAAKLLAEDMAALAKMAGLSPDFYKEWDKLNDMFKRGKLDVDGLTQAQATLLAKQPAIKAAADEQAKAQQVIAKANLDAAASREKYLTSLSTGLDKIQADIAAQEEATARMGLSKEAIAALDAAKLEMLATDLELQAIKAMDRNLDQQTYDALMAQAKAYRELGNAKRAGAARETAVEEAKEAADEWQRTSDQINQSLTDALLRGFESGKDFAKNLRDTVVNMFKTMVLRPVIRAVVNPVAGAITGALGLSSAAQAGQGGASSGVSTAISGASLLGSVGGSLAAGAGWLTGATTFTGALGAAGSLIGTGTAAGIGSGLTMGAGALAPILAPLALLAMSGAFSRKHEQHNLQGTFGGASGFEGNWHDYYKGGLFRSSKTVDTPIEAGFLKQLRDAWKTQESAVQDYAETLGLATGKIDGFTYSINLKLKDIDVKDENAYQQAVMQRVSEAIRAGSNEMAQMLIGSWESVTETVARTVQTYGDEGGFSEIEETIERSAYVASEFARDGEQAIDTLTRLATSLRGVNSVFDTLGYTLIASGLAGADVASRIADAFGGLDAMGAATSSYWQNFYTEEERAATLTRQLTDQLSALGLTMPSTRAGFRAIVEQFQAAAVAGDEGAAVTFAALVNLSMAFSEVTPALDEAASAAEQMASRIDTIFSQLSDMWSDQIDNWKQLADEAGRIADMAGSAARSLRGNVDETRMQDARSANSYIDQALAGLRATGALPDSKELADAIAAARGGLDMSQYDTLAEMERDQLILAGKLGELGDKAGVQMSFAEQQVDLLEQQRDYWRQQIDLLTATGETITSIDQGIEYLADYVREQAALKAAEEAEKEASREAARRATLSISPGGWGGGGWGGGGGQDLTSITRTINWDTGEYVYPDGSGGTLTAEELEYFRRILDGELDPTRIISDLYQVPRHADGGRYAGGLALVGERGPELINFASPGHVYTADQTRDMMRGGDNAELIAELRELRARLDKIERNTAVLPQTHDVIDRVTAGGNAMLTEAA